MARVSSSSKRRNIRDGTEHRADHSNADRKRAKAGSTADSRQQTKVDRQHGRSNEREQQDRFSRSRRSLSDRTSTSHRPTTPAASNDRAAVATCTTPDFTTNHRSRAQTGRDNQTLARREKSAGNHQHHHNTTTTNNNKNNNNNSAVSSSAKANTIPVPKGGDRPTQRLNRLLSALHANRVLAGWNHAQPPPGAVTLLAQDVHAVVDADCSICLEPPKVGRKVLLRCGHLYCKACIGRWLAVKTTCPVCKQPHPSLSLSATTQQAHLSSGSGSGIGIRNGSGIGNGNGRGRTRRF